MPIQVNVHDAKTQLSALLDRVLGGEEVVIAKAGRPVARLVPLAVGAAGARVPGNRAGQLRMAEDFDADLDAEFLGGELVPSGEP